MNKITEILRVFEEVRKKLVKMKVSFPREETLKKSNVRVKDNKLYFSFYFFLFSFSFIFIF